MVTWYEIDHCMDWKVKVSIAAYVLQTAAVSGTSCQKFKHASKINIQNSTSLEFELTT